MGETLGWLSGEGWSDYFSRRGEPWDTWNTAEDFRQRHLVDALRTMVAALKRRR